MNNFVIQPQPARGFEATQKHTAPQTGTATPPTPSEVAHEQIARRAYEIYVAKGREQGQCQQNWRQAERELRRQAATPGSLRFTETAPAHSGSDSVGRKFTGAATAVKGGTGPQA